MAKVVPFPIARRQAFIERRANRAVELNPEAGESYIREQIARQARAMRRKGIADDLIEREMRIFEAAIRRSLWDAVMGGGPKSAL